VRPPGNVSIGDGWRGASPTSSERAWISSASIVATTSSVAVSTVSIRVSRGAVEDLQLVRDVEAVVGALHRDRLAERGHDQRGHHVLGRLVVHPGRPHVGRLDAVGGAAPAVVGRARDEHDQDDGDGRRGGRSDAADQQLSIHLSPLLEVSWSHTVTSDHPDAASVRSAGWRSPRPTSPGGNAVFRRHHEIRTPLAGSATRSAAPGTDSR
jgi:hypothetical protein